VKIGIYVGFCFLWQERSIYTAKAHANKTNYKSYTLKEHDVYVRLFLGYSNRNRMSMLEKKNCLYMPKRFII
jgi:hypothetical protein